MYIFRDRQVMCYSVCFFAHVIPIIMIIMLIMTIIGCRLKSAIFSAKAPEDSVTPESVFVVPSFNFL